MSHDHMWGLEHGLTRKLRASSHGSGFSSHKTRTALSLLWNRPQSMTPSSAPFYNEDSQIIDLCLRQILKTCPCTTQAGLKTRVSPDDTKIVLRACSAVFTSTEQSRACSQLCVVEVDIAISWFHREVMMYWKLCQYGYIYYFIKFIFYDALLISKIYIFIQNWVVK